jgi:hypothetical protein
MLPVGMKIEVKFGMLVGRAHLSRGPSLGPLLSVRFWCLEIPFLLRRGSSRSKNGNSSRVAGSQQVLADGMWFGDRGDDSHLASGVRTSFHVELKNAGQKDAPREPVVAGRNLFVARCLASCLAGGDDFVSVPGVWSQYPVISHQIDARRRYQCG